MQGEVDLPSGSQLMTLQPQEFVNIRQTQEQINLLRRIANAISEDSSRSILSRLIILILLICLYGWLTYDFYDANGLFFIEEDNADSKSLINKIGIN